MTRIFRSLIVGSMVGAAVGLMMMANRRRGMMDAGRVNQKARGTMRMVRDNTARLTSALRDGGEAFSRRLARRMS